MKRFLLFAISYILAVHGNAAEPPTKKGGGLFGFGAPQGDQISAGLFPSANAPTSQGNEIVTSTRPSSSGAPANPSTSRDNTIFRSGQPQRVDAVSYVIEKGRKVEQPITPPVPVASPTPVATMSAPTTTPGVEFANSEGKKKGGFFAFGKNNNAAADNNAVVTPVPEPLKATPMTTSPAPMVTPPKPVVTTAKPVASPMPTATPSLAAAETPAFEGIKKEKEEKSGWGPFRSRKKPTEPVTMETPVASPIVAAPVVATAAKPSESGTKPATTVAAAPATTTFEVPRSEPTKEELKKEEKSNRDGGGILAPITNMRLPRKEIDLSSAETIIQNGEIVAGANTTFDAAPITNSSGPRQAPQIVNGVKTYSSWDDVNASSSSAADKIINRMR